VHRKREHVVAAAQDLCGPVALVHVQIDHAGPADHSFVDQHRNRHRGIVKDTVPFARVGHGVMRAAGQVDRDAVGDRRASRRDRGTGAAPRPFDHLGRPGKPDAANFGRRQRPPDDGIDVSASVA
jgi:hypothetical protein